MNANQQSDLCLSCGVPFMPSADQVEFFKHKGNLSILYLNVEFQQNRDLQRTHKILKFTSESHASHVFHASHHIAAIHYMTQRHRGDSPLTWPAGIAGFRRLPNAFNAAFAYIVPPKGVNPQPYAATWAAPPTRLNYRPLLRRILNIAWRHGNRDALLGQNLTERHAICAGCNFIMTQEANMKYHLGITQTALQNPYGGIITGQPLRIRPVNNNGARVENAYGNWDIDMAANAERNSPSRTANDFLTPHIAYYLHMCLPRGPVNPFHIPGSGNSARRLYLELSWIILTIACVATLIEDGKRYGDGRLSHGPQQHLGVLDFYVSYFFWRLIEFEHTERVRHVGLDFIQWHQKYYWEAVHCKALFSSNTGAACNFIGFLAYGTTHQNSSAFVQEICDRLMRLYAGPLQPLVLFVSGQQQGLPSEIRDYFVPLRTMRELRNRSNLRVTHHVFLFFECFKPTQ